MIVEALPRTAAAKIQGDPDSLTIRRPIAVDLFAGAGGLSLGLEQAGFDIVASVEYDPVHCAVHKYNFPRTEVICADISDVSKRELRLAIKSGLQLHGRDLGDWDGEVDLVAGGPPCQGFSTIGKRLIEDKRNRLVFEFFRVVRDLRPRYFVMENVPGMLAGGHKSAILDRLIAEFGEIGYEVLEPPRILNASWYGVPQDRRRLVLLGARSGQTVPAYPTPTVAPRPKNEATKARPVPFDGSLPPGPSVWDAIGDLPDADAFDQLRDNDEVPVPSEALHAPARTGYAGWLSGLATDELDMSHPRQWDRGVLTSSLRTIHTAESIRRFSDTKPGDTEPVSRFYRLTKEGLCNTIRAGTGSEHGAFTSPRPLHPTLPRVLTVREAARLHSFPDWFRLHATKWHGFRQIGNAVPPLMGRAVGQSIVAALGVRPPRPSGLWPLGDVCLLRLDMSESAAYFDADQGSIPAQRTRRLPEGQEHE